MKKRLAFALVGSILGAIGLAAACAPGEIETPQANDPCITAGNESTPTPAQQAGNTAPAMQPAGYVVGRSDVLAIRVEPDMAPNSNQQCSKDYEVGEDGMINFCDLGALKVEGQTQRQIEELIRKEFQTREIYMSPVVTVGLKDYRSQVVYVNGAVRTAGEVSLKGDQMTLAHAVSNAGGYSENAGPDVYIKRPRPSAAGVTPGAVLLEDPTSETFKYSRKGMLDNFEDPPVRNGDSIWVTQAEMFYISGEVKAGGQKNWDPCMNLGQALAIASGITDKASLRRSYIQRPNGKGGYDRIGNLKLDTRIFPKDQINISRSLF